MIHRIISFDITVFSAEYSAQDLTVGDADKMNTCRPNLPLFNALGIFINGIAAIYDIRKSDQAKLFRNTIVEVGTISTADKAAISALKSFRSLSLPQALLMP